jgi:hypothetical protein
VHVAAHHGQRGVSWCLLERHDVDPALSATLVAKGGVAELALGCCKGCCNAATAAG